MKQNKITLKDAWEGLKLTWAEWHAIVIGLGDGIAFHKTDWLKIKQLCPNDEDIEGEMHYYKFGLSLGRLAWAGIIALILWGAGVIG